MSKKTNKAKIREISKNDTIEVVLGFSKRPYLSFVEFQRNLGSNDPNLISGISFDVKELGVLISLSLDTLIVKSFEGKTINEIMTDNEKQQMASEMGLLMANLALLATKLNLELYDIAQDFLDSLPEESDK